MSPTVLVLGGTAEARELAAALDERPGTRVISTLAGAVRNPRLPEGEVRIGGFGGSERLAKYLAAEGVDAVVDATHPFAERMSASAASACERAGLPLVRLERPPWNARLGDDWRRVATLEEAAALIPSGARVFLTTGRQGLRVFAPVAHAFFLVRCVDPPPPEHLPPDHELILDRGPYGIEGELALIDGHRLDILVTKDSGGEHTAPKLDAARARGLSVIVVNRPPRPDTPAVATVAAALAWLDHPG